MRVEPYSVGSFLHVVKRGARGLPIVRDESDQWRFLKMLFLLNDESFDKNWVYEKQDRTLFYRPQRWPARDPVVDILAYTLMPNHLHLILKEIKEGGMSLFMKRLAQSMTNHANEKYDESGSLFQGAYRSKTIADDVYLRYVSAYVMAKNTMELYPDGGLMAAQQDFDKVWNWAVSYPFTSLGDYTGVRKDTPIVTSTILKKVLNESSFKEYCRDMILGGRWKDKNKVLE